MSLDLGILGISFFLVLGRSFRKVLKGMICVEEQKQKGTFFRGKIAKEPPGFGQVLIMLKTPTEKDSQVKQGQ